MAVRNDLLAYAEHYKFGDWLHLAREKTFNFEYIGAREKAVRYWAWAIPNAEALDALAALAPIIEIGAGTGYWAYLLQLMGVDVIAYDAVPPIGEHENGWHKNEDGDSHMWFDVLVGGLEQAAKHPDRTLFLCWPPYDETMAEETLRAYAGNNVVYIGEGLGGCTANDNFHAMLDQDWEVVQVIHIPQWYGLHDDMTIYRRIQGSAT